MERLVASAADNSYAKSVLLSLAASSEAYQAHQQRSRELIRDSVELAVANDEKEAAATYQIRAGLIEAYFGNPEQARADADSALKLYTKGYVPTYAALVFALTGDTARADKFTAQQDRRFGSATAWRSYCLPTIRAAAALHRKNALQAIEFLRTASAYELGAFDRFDPMYLRGEAYLMLHDGQAAMREFRKIIDHPGVMGVSPLGALAHLGLARAHALVGEKGNAEAEYKRFLNIWEDADPDIPILKQAKAEYARLQ
jgi:tetratricopeptide (TPR) repeat protein